MSDDEYALLEAYESSQGHTAAAPNSSKRALLDNGVAPLSAPMCRCGAGRCEVETGRDGRQYFICPEEEGAQCSFRLACDSVKASRTSADGPAAGQAYDAQQANWNSGNTAGPGDGGTSNGCYNSNANGWNSQQQQQQAQGADHGSYQQQQYGSNGPAGTPGNAYNSSSLGGQGYSDLPLGVETPNCDCGDPAAFRTSNSERNPGRQFFGCGKRVDDPSRCRYFCWLDQLGKSPASRTSVGGAGGPGAYVASAAAAAPAAGNDAGVLCVCGAPAVSRTSNTPKNPGRVFYKCPKPQGEQCDWFKWGDELEAPPRTFGNGAAGAGGGGGGYNNSSYNGGSSSYGFGNSNGAAAAAGFGGNLSGLNVGGGANAAAGSQGGSARFAWEDAGPAPQTANHTTSYGNTGFGGGSSGNDVCYKCNQTGHWARDCPNAGGGAAGGGGGGGSGVCYKCNQPGHWARDCPNSGGGSNAGGGGYGAGGGGGGGVCYKCNQPGHWARDCPNPGGGGGGYNSNSSGYGSNGYGGGGGRYGAGGRGGGAYGGRGGGGGRGACLKCGETGHWASTCPNK